MQTPQDRNSFEKFRKAERFSSFTASYLSMPPTTVCDEISISRPFAIDFSFSAHDAVLVRRPGGKTTRRRVPPGSGGVTGGDGLAWVRVPEPYECVEIVPDSALLGSVTDELRCPDASGLAEISGQRDPVLWAAATRVRSHVRGGLPLSDIEAESLARSLVAHLMCEYLGVKPRRVNARPLDRRRLERVSDYIDAHLHQPITISTLADIAAMSPFHFAKTFKATTGLAPHAFVTARRMQRARKLLLSGTFKKKEVARQVGYHNVNHFKRMLRIYFGLETHPTLSAAAINP
ncbi:MAG: AraC family transcriptional regulator [Pseudomonadota bacterium]